MYFKCCVRNCVSTREDAILHKFPTNEDRLNKWLQCLKDDACIQTSSLKNLFVCHKHFEKRYIGANSRLKTKAHPTLFTSDEISSGIPAEPMEYVAVELEHSYNRKRHYDHTYCKDTTSGGPSLSKRVPAPLEVRSQNIFEPGSSQYSTQSQKNYSVQQSSAMETDCQPIECANVASCTDVISAPQMSVVSTLQADITQSPLIEEPPLTNLRVEVRSVTPKGVLSPSHEKHISTTPTVKKSSRKRVIQSLNKLSPKCKKIYERFTKAKKQVDFYRRAKQALKFTKENAFERLTKDLNPYAKTIIEMQINLCTKKKKGRRFTLEEKLISLSIMKQSPKCYRFLHKIFILPSSSTLNKMVSNINLEAGINKQFIKLMKKEVDTWPDAKKHCSIIFDEMSLGMGLSYNRKKDRIDGFVELNDRKARFADHVLVFMARGAVHKWQQPIAYYFCEGATSGPDLKTIIKEIVNAVAEIGLNPLVLGCDQGTAFQYAVKSLREDTRREQLLHNEQPDDTIIIGNNKLNIIYDPSHLIKGIRNNFLTKDIIYEGKISRWQDIVDVYKTDCKHTESRLLHKLNDEHVIPDKVKKMKVKNCVRVLSKTVAAALSYTSQFSHYVDGSPVSKTLPNTAETVSFFDDLFDSINGTSLSIKAARGKILRTAVCDSSKHHKFWLDAINRLEKTKFIERGSEKTVPTLKNFVITIKSYLNLWQVLKNKNIKIMRPRYFNTDPIENYFGQVRAYNYRNNDPTCHNFINTFKALTITRVIKFHSASFNCEDDSAEPMLNLRNLFNDEDSVVERRGCQDVLPGHSDKSAERINIDEKMLDQVRRERLNIHSRAYTTGWVIRKIFEKVKCKTCKLDLVSNPEETLHKWVSNREYKETKNLKKLIYPSGKAVRCFGTVLTHTNEYLELNAYKLNLIQNIESEIMSKYSFELVDCAEHQRFVKKYFISIVIRFAIFNWCNVITKILKGVDIERLNINSFPHFQKLALIKHRKKLKNKSFNKYLICFIFRFPIQLITLFIIQKNKYLLKTQISYL